MARFVLGNRLGKAADRSSTLQRILWLAEAGVFRGFLAIMRRLPVERATSIGRRRPDERR